MTPSNIPTTALEGEEGSQSPLVHLTVPSNETGTRHTPGPWFAEGEHVWAGDDKCEGAITQGGCGCCNGWKEGVYGEANARLIASAPDMLEALQTVMGYPEVRSYLGSIVSNKADAAIARATGATK